MLRYFGDNYYFLDTSMLYAYDVYTRRLSGWKEYVDNLSRKGQHFFVTPSIHYEWARAPAGKKMPLPFKKLFLARGVHKRITKAYNQVLNEFGVSSAEFEQDLKWILESGVLTKSSGDIAQAHAKRRLFAITTDFRVGPS